MKEEHSVKQGTRAALPEMSWKDITKPGAYVEVGSGDLYRIPHEALVKGASPIITKESLGASRFVRMSENPFVTLFAARVLCADQNIEPNF